MDQEQKLELGRQIWQLRRAGYDRIGILEELAISVHELEDCLSAFESRLPAEAARVMEGCFWLENERIENLIETWMGIALGEEGQALQSASDSEFDLRLKASYAVLAAIDARQKVILASQSENTSARERETDVVAWLGQLHAAGDAGDPLFKDSSGAPQTPLET